MTSLEPTITYILKEDTPWSEERGLDFGLLCFEFLQFCGAAGLYRAVFKKYEASASIFELACLGYQRRGPLGCSQGVDVGVSGQDIVAAQAVTALGNTAAAFH